MSSENSTDGFSKTRRVLGDLTNRPIKRGFSLISVDPGPKSGGDLGKNVDSGNGDSKFAKKVSLGVESLVRDKCEIKLGAGSNLEPVSSPKGPPDSNPEALSSPKSTPDSGFSPTYSALDDSLNEDSESVTLSMSNDIGEKSTDSGANASSVMEVGDALLDNCSSVVSISKCSGLCKNDCCGGGEKCKYEKSGQTIDGSQSVRLFEEMVTVIRGNDKTKLPRSQGCSKFHEFEKLERCTTLKGDGTADLNAGDDLLNDCSCSFCLKAAHILSDLQYQDIKGRIAALKKSKKEASILVEKSFRGKEIDTMGRLHTSKASTLEYDLTSQWRSLFLHVEDMLAHESNHLQDSYATLKDLRDNCKTELETTSGVPSERQ